MAFFFMVHGNQLNLTAGVARDVTAPNRLQNLHDIPSLQNLGKLLSEMTTNPAHSVSMLSVSQAAQLGSGPTNLIP